MTEGKYKLRGASADFGLTGLTAFVTGGSSNLGFGMAQALAAGGARVGILGRNEEKLEVATRRLNESPGTDIEHFYVVGDLFEDATFEEAAGLTGSVDILVNNAGGAVHDTTWELQTASDWRDILELNVVAVNRLTQVFVPGMMQKGWGRVINIASIFGVVAPDPQHRRPGSEGAAYTVAKHAVVGLTKFLAVRLGDTGVTVNAISPGRFPLASDDPVRNERAERTWTPDLLEQWVQMTPARRVGTPEDIAGAVVFLASKSSNYVTGHNLVVDGGWVLT